ncbi:MAG: tetratricopeptide repeat protein [Rhodospirillaceae bacterium]
MIGLDKLRRAVAFHQNGELDEARELYSKVLLESPNHSDALRLLAVLENSLGNHQKALALLKTGIKSSPDNKLLLFTRGIVLAGMGNFEHAKAAYEKAIAVDPNFNDAKLNLGALLQQEEDIEGACALYQDMLSGLPNSRLALFNLMRALTNLSSVRELTDLELKALVSGKDMLLKADPEMLQLVRKDTVTYLGRLANSFKTLKQEEHFQECLNGIVQAPTQTVNDLRIKSWALFAVGNLDAALEMVATVNNTLPLHRMGALLERNKIGALRALPKVDGSWPNPSSNPVVFAAATADYVSLFGVKFASSILRTSAALDVHLHILNPDDTIFKPAEEFLDLSGGRFTWTTEDVGERDRAVYASRRFLRLPEILQFCQRQIICLDIDSIANDDIGHVISSLVPFDAVTYDRPNEIYINQQVAAGFLAVSPTDFGLRFSNLIASYINHFESRGEEKWYVDQMAIWMAKLWFQDYEPSGRIKSAPTNFLNWDKSSQSGLISTAKGGDKNWI